MRLPLTAAFATLLAGCTTASYYEPEQEENIYRAGSACSTTVSYRGAIDGMIGLTVQATPHSAGVEIKVGFRVPRGQTLQLQSSEFGARLDASTQVMTASVITTGSQPLRIPIVEYAPTDLLTAQGRYAHLAAPYGPDDLFLVRLEFKGFPPRQFALVLPPVSINGKVASQAALIPFVLRSESRLACVQ